MHWTVGKIKITKIVELETTGGTRFILPQAGPEDIRRLPWLVPHFATEEGRLKMSIHALIVETPTQRIVVDTCLGNDKQGRKVPTWNHLQKPFLEDMTAAGYPPDSIDLVLCTHLHVDHDISLIPTPGHSPGHVSVHIRSDGEQALLTGDVAHHPCQMAHLDWSSTADHDPTQAATTRRELFSRFADTPTLLIGGHFSAGGLKRDGDAFRLAP
jgi:glyoxylase-like metal-dependent hydrolase (beta-lactamase superfamily II)